MPIYEYSCSKCGEKIEVIQKFSDPILKKHKGCGGNLTKLISASGFQFKGTGWYVTDYARKSKGDSESSTSKKEPSTTTDTSSGDSSSKSPGTSTKPKKSSDS